jgi:heme A synthase
MPPGLASVRHLARHQIMGLVSVFLLGMAVNLTGLPSQTSGGAHLASIAFLAAHALIALGLIIGTVLLVRAVARLGGQWRRRAVAGAAAIAAAVAAGILTVFTSSNWWSYIMAVGFITALLAYGSLLLPATAPADDSTPSSAPQV